MGRVNDKIKIRAAAIGSLAGIPEDEVVPPPDRQFLQPVDLDRMAVSEIEMSPLPSEARENIPDTLQTEVLRSLPTPLHHRPDDYTASGLATVMLLTAATFFVLPRTEQYVKWGHLSLIVVTALSLAIKLPKSKHPVLDKLRLPLYLLLLLPLMVLEATLGTPTSPKTAVDFVFLLGMLDLIVLIGVEILGHSTKRWRSRYFNCYSAYARRSSELPINDPVYVNAAAMLIATTIGLFIHTQNKYTYLALTINTLCNFAVNHRLQTADKVKKYTANLGVILGEAAVGVGLYLSGHSNIGLPFIAGSILFAIGTVTEVITDALASCECSKPQHSPTG